jgi:hypothetical protein
LILSLLWIFGIGSLCAIICGHSALKNIRYSGGHVRGEGLAIAGLALGYLGLVPAALFILGMILS